MQGVYFTYSNAAPASPRLGDRWLYSESLVELVYVYDGTSYQWVEVSSQAGAGAVRDLSNLITTSINASLVPASNVTYDLGSSSLRWRDLYLSGNTIDLGGTAIKSSANGVSFTSVANAAAAVPLTVSSLQIASATGNVVTLQATATGLQTVGTTGNVVATTPGGSSGQLQYNLDGAFAGAANVVYASTGQLLRGASSARTNWLGGGGAIGFQNEGLDAVSGSMGTVRGGVNGFPAYLIIGKTRSATVGGSDAVVNNDLIGTLDFQAADGTNMIRTAGIGAAVDGTVSTGVVPGRLAMFTANAGGVLTERVRIDKAGNMGIGTSPNAWSNNSKAIEITGAVLFSAAASNAQLGSNFYRSADSPATWVYKSTAAAANYEQYLGGHYWTTAVSGTAGNVISWTSTMSLDPNGNLGIGTNSPSSYAMVAIRKLTAAQALHVYTNDVSNSTIVADFKSYDNTLGETSRFTIKAGGYIGVNTSSPTAPLDVVSENTGGGVIRTTRYSASGPSYFDGRTAGGTLAAPTDSTSFGLVMQGSGYRNSGFRSMGYINIYGDGLATTGNGIKGYIGFYTSDDTSTNVERVRINSAGQLLIPGATNNGSLSGARIITGVVSSSPKNPSVITYTSSAGTELHGIGTSNNQFDITVAGTSNDVVVYTGTTVSSATEKLRISNSGNFIAQSPYYIGSTSTAGTIISRVNMINTDMTTNSSSFDSITNNATGGATTWSIVKDSYIYFSSTSGGHNGNWGASVYLEAGYWRWAGAVRVSTANGAVHGSTSSSVYHLTHSFEFTMSGGPSTGTRTFNTTLLGDKGRASFSGTPVYKTAGVYQSTYSTSGYDGIKQVYITDLYLERVG
jgi:hypothetical protein